jgi:hypothetical protein
VLAGLSVGFDASCEEMWLAWRHGGALGPAPRSLVRAASELGPWLAERRVSVVSTAPTLAGMWDEPDLDRVRLVILGGEACPESLVERLSLVDVEQQGSAGEGARRRTRVRPTPAGITPLLAPGARRLVALMRTPAAGRALRLAVPAIHAVRRFLGQQAGCDAVRACVAPASACVAPASKWVPDVDRSGPVVEIAVASGRRTER